jgi:hypothetical protein
MYDSLQQADFVEMYTRRKAIYEQEFQALMSTHLFVKSYMAEFTAVAGPQRAASQQTRTSVRQPWIRPPLGYMKINVDSAIGRHGDGGVAAAICRDHLGNYIGSSGNQLHGYYGCANFGSRSMSRGFGFGQ